MLRNTAEGETGHAHGHMEYLIAGGSGDPETGLAAGNVAEALESAIAGGTHEHTGAAPGYGKSSSRRGFDEQPTGSKHQLKLASRQ